MKKAGKNDVGDIEKIKIFLEKLGFVCNSDPLAQHLIYSKNGETVIIRNNK